MSSEEFFQYGLADHRAGRFAQAEIWYSQVLARQPDDAQALHYMGLVGHKLGRPDALARLRRARSLCPDYSPFHNNLGAIVQTLGRYDEARACFERAVALDPDYADAHYNLGLILLLRGDFSRGFHEAEWRWLSDQFKSSQFECPQPIWDGRPLHGRRLLLHPEQGLGDSLQFLRYVPLLLEHEPDARLILLSHRGISTLVERNFAACCTVTTHVEPEDFDFRCSLMDLPVSFGTTVETIPAPVPYLHASVEKTQKWRARLAGDTRPVKVGLAWAGQRTHLQDRRRSMPLATLAALTRLEGVSFYSLQKGPAETEVNFTPGVRITDFTGALHDFDDTAALVENMDLVLTVDTAVAHLAGAMGKPVWVLLPSNPDWRWLLGREDSPWYPTMRLFRQKSPGEWNEVLQRVARALRELHGAV